MQRWKCCSSWSKQNPKHFSNTGFPQGKPVFFCSDIEPQKVIGEKSRWHPAAPVKLSVVRGLASLKQEEGRTKRVAKKCFKLLRYRAFSAHIFSAPEWPGEGKGRRAYCLSFLRRILWSDRTKRVGKKCSLHRNGWGKGRGAYGLFFLWRALYERGAEQRGRAHRMAECTEKERYEWLVLSGNIRYT